MDPSYIGEDLAMTGYVVSKSEVRVEGEIQGDIRCKSLVVGENGRVAGQVVAEDMLRQRRSNRR